MAKTSIAVMLQIETNDPRLVHASVGTVENVTRLRAAVMDALRNLRNVSRVIAVFPPEHADLLMQLHVAVGDDIGRHLGVLAEGESVVDRPPPEYEPPGGR